MKAMESISEFTTDIWLYGKKTFFSLISTLTLSDLWDLFYEAWEDWHSGMLSSPSAREEL